MRVPAMPIEKRDCPHCQVKGSLAYKKESLPQFGVEQDLYYCKKCFLTVLWNGEATLAVEVEAYPDREEEKKPEKEDED